MSSSNVEQRLEEDGKEVVHKPLDENCAPEVIEIDDESLENEPINSNHAEPHETFTTDKSNPFALFAFQSTEPLPPKRKLDSSTTNKSRFQKWTTVKEPTSSNNTTSNNNNNKKPKTESSTSSKKPKCFPPPKMKDVSVEEQDRIRRKWHSLLDQQAPLEAQRFQMLVAARLHARCQEASVLKAMTQLRETFPNFAVDTFADADPESIVPCIKNVVHYNVKAQQIVKAAQEVRSKFDGIVPEDEKSLLELTGIGAVFADLLAFVNTRAAYDKIKEEKWKRGGDTIRLDMHPLVANLFLCKVRMYDSL